MMTEEFMRQNQNLADDSQVGIMYTEKEFPARSCHEHDGCGNAATPLMHQSQYGGWWEERREGGAKPPRKGTDQGASVSFETDRSRGSRLKPLVFPPISLFCFSYVVESCVATFCASPPV